MKKRVYLTFVFIVIIFSLSGCRFSSQSINRSEIKKQISENILKKKNASSEKENDDEKYIKIIIKSIHSKNTDLVYEELSKELQNRAGINKQLEELVNFTDSQNLKVDQKTSSTSWWEATDKRDKNENCYTTVKKDPRFLLSDENNKKYHVTIYYYPNYKEHPEKTGINWIEIAEEDENDNFIRILDI